MAGKTSAPKATAKPDPVADKAWELYVRLCESPAYAGKTQEHIVSLAFERARAFVEREST